MPGGKSNPGESLADTTRRELHEEAGIVVETLDRHVWDREVRYYLRGQWHHRRDAVFLTYADESTPSRPTNHTHGK
ncbi:NUDIX hydrolase [Saccharopolyspora hattusasensis]|uniref:NUDIX hydrolase n=1 Tax=Saccharopolyspora hattusasensis TaxID=1128679 RepID=UPI003D98531F